MPYLFTTGSFQEGLPHSEEGHTIWHFCMPVTASTPPVDETAPVLQGTLSFHDTHVRVLFDTEASHSFTSVNLCEKFEHNLKHEPVSKSLCVSNPIGGPRKLKNDL